MRAIVILLLIVTPALAQQHPVIPPDPGPPLRTNTQYWRELCESGKFPIHNTFGDVFYKDNPAMAWVDMQRQRDFFDARCKQVLGK